MDGSPSGGPHSCGLLGAALALSRSSLSAAVARDCLRVACSCVGTRQAELVRSGDGLWGSLLPAVRAHCHTRRAFPLRATAWPHTGVAPSLQLRSLVKQVSSAVSHNRRALRTVCLEVCRRDVSPLKACDCPSVRTRHATLSDLLANVHVESELKNYTERSDMCRRAARSRTSQPRGYAATVATRRSPHRSSRATHEPQNRPDNALARLMTHNTSILRVEMHA